MESAFLRASLISRSTGRSSIAAAAYRACTRLVDALTGLVHDYTMKRGRLGGGVELPLEAPRWSREELWHAVERAEKRKDAQLARELILALDHRLSVDDNMELVRRFVRSLVDQGMGVQWDVHAPDRRGDQRNFHAHLLLTTRRIGTDGISAKKERAWNSEAWLTTQKACWLELCQTAQREFEHATWSQPGARLTPEIHEGPAATRRVQKNLPCDVRTFNDATKQDNSELLSLRGLLERTEDQILVVSNSLSAETPNDLAVAAEADISVGPSRRLPLLAPTDSAEPPRSFPAAPTRHDLPSETREFTEPRDDLPQHIPSRKVGVGPVSDPQFDFSRRKRRLELEEEIQDLRRRASDLEQRAQQLAPRTLGSTDPEDYLPPEVRRRSVDAAVALARQLGEQLSALAKGLTDIVIKIIDAIRRVLGLKTIAEIKAEATAARARAQELQALRKQLLPDATRRAQEVQQLQHREERSVEQQRRLMLQEAADCRRDAYQMELSVNQPGASARPRLSEANTPIVRPATAPHPSITWFPPQSAEAPDNAPRTH